MHNVLKDYPIEDCLSNSGDDIVSFVWRDSEGARKVFWRFNMSIARITLYKEDNEGTMRIIKLKVGIDKIVEMITDAEVCGENVVVRANGMKVLGSPINALNYIVDRHEEKRQASKNKWVTRKRRAASLMDDLLESLEVAESKGKKVNNRSVIKQLHKNIKDSEEEITDAEQKKLDIEAMFERRLVDKEIVESGKAFEDIMEEASSKDV